MNNSKQAVLSIVGIAILVIAVVGVSFAFFTYSRTGTTNNLITTGTIEFDSDIDSASALVLENRFPQTDTQGMAEQEEYEFNVHGTIPATANDVYYGVFVEEGATPSQKNAENKFPYGQISVYVNGAKDENVTDANANDSTVVVSRFGTNGTHVLTSSVTKPSGHSDGELVAYGMIDNTGIAQQHNYTLKMWVNNTVTISDTDTTKTYRASSTSVGDVVGTDTRKVYTNMWYTIKVTVKARDSGSYASLATS